MLNSSPTWTTAHLRTSTRLTAAAALEWISNLRRYGLNPPIALSLLAFRDADFEAAGTDRMTPAMVGYAMIGVAIYGLTALGLWRQLQRQFAKVTGRAG